MVRLNDRPSNPDDGGQAAAPAAAATGDRVAGTPAPRYAVEAGRAHPLGAVPDADGVNFAIFSEHATAVELLLFDDHDDIEPIQVVKLDARLNNTFCFWHVYVRGLRAGAHYAYRVDG